jgi:hypothetical protein
MIVMTAPSLVRRLVRVALIFLFACLGAYAQSEIDPDHFESHNVEPFDKAKASGDAASIHYDGRFSLPYAVQCNGTSLRPGKYSVSLRSDGKVGQAILNQKGQAVKVVGFVRTQGGKRGNDALVVEHKGKTHRLSTIQVAELELVFDRELQVKSSPDNTPPRTERLPLTVMVPKK